jgi:hypothetical protein
MGMAQYVPTNRSQAQTHARRSKRLVFLADLIEVHLIGSPSLVEIRDLHAIALRFSFLESDKIRL